MSKRKTLLITGGTGYIGSHAVVAFGQVGYKTVILDNLVNSSRDTLRGIKKILGYCPEFFECDIRDRIWLEKIFQKYEFDGVMHFAGLKSVGESCQNISLYLHCQVHLVYSKIWEILEYTNLSGILELLFVFILIMI